MVITTLYVRVACYQPLLLATKLRTQSKIYPETSNVLSSSFHTDEATFSSQCYPRVRLGGCKGKLLRYERESLARFTSAAFWVAAIHMANIVIGLLSSNHVNR